MRNALYVALVITGTWLAIALAGITLALVLSLALSCSANAARPAQPSHSAYLRSWNHYMARGCFQTARHQFLCPDPSPR